MLGAACAEGAPVAATLVIFPVGTISAEFATFVIAGVSGVLRVGLMGVIPPESPLAAAVDTEFVVPFTR